MLVHSERVFRPLCINGELGASRVINVVYVVLRIGRARLLFNAGLSFSLRVSAQLFVWSRLFLVHGCCLHESFQEC